MAGFEQACADRKLPLYVLPPRSPKLNGAVDDATPHGDTSSMPASNCRKKSTRLPNTSMPCTEPCRTDPGPLQNHPKQQTSPSQWRDLGHERPKCGFSGRINAIVGVKDKKGQERLGLKKCYDCRGQFTVPVGTIFERSHVPSQVWFRAAYLMCSSKKGVSSNQLHRTLGVSLQTPGL